MTLQGAKNEAQRRANATDKTYIVCRSKSSKDSDAFMVLVALPNNYEAFAVITSLAKQ